MAELPQVTTAETKQILQLAEDSLAVPGDLVELGCYRGDTSLLLAQLLKKSSSDKKLWIYDSFEGLPPKSAFDQSVAGDNFQAGELKVSKREVIERFKKAGLKVPVVKKGFFDQLDPFEDFPEQIAFAFLDGDLYDSISVSLKLVFPKMAENGLIVVHDYNNPELPGVTKAVDEFLQNHPMKLENKASLAILYI